MKYDVYECDVDDLEGRRGHVRMPPERREALLAEYERSGLSLARFTELAGVRYSTFATWLQHRRIKTGEATQDKEKKKDRPEQVCFAEMLVDAGLQPAPAVPGVLKVLRPGGAQMVITNATQIPLAMQLLKALLEPRPC